MSVPVCVVDMVLVVDVEPGDTIENAASEISSALADSLHLATTLILH